MVPLAHLSWLWVMAQTAQGAPVEETPGSDLVIKSNSNCPSGETVREALARLRPPDEWPEAVVVVRATETAISIEVGAKSAIRRQLAVGLDCEIRASAAALVIATWMDDLPAEAIGAPLLHGPVVARPAAPPQPPRPARYEVGAALAAAVGGGLAPGLRAEIVRMPGHGWVGVYAGLSLVGPRDVSVGQSVSTWLRTSIGLGLHARHSAERTFIAVDLGLAGGMTSAWGTGYATDSSDHAFTWGPAAGVRAGVRWNRLRPWVELRGGYWAKGDSVRIDSPSPAWVETVPLPSWEAQASLGLAYALP